jgi:hypothetical protein
MREALQLMVALFLFAIGVHMLARPVSYTKGRRAWPLWAVRPLGIANIAIACVMLYLTYQLLTQG